MKTGWKNELRENLCGPVIVPSITAGLVAGILTVTFMFSYSAVIFTGELSGYVPQATGQLLRKNNRTRAKGEHAFRIVKDLWGYSKVRYRGIEKNAAQVFTLFALANLYLCRRDLQALAG
jgi:hypothetical protein